MLLTAFEPFDDTDLNSSLEALRRLIRRDRGAVREHLVLPVRYGDDAVLVEQSLRRRTPRAVLHLGQGHGAAVSVERIGINLRVDRVGDRVVHRAILPGAPAAYRSTIPVDAIVTALVDAGIPVADSAYAGAYLCNHVLYRTLHYAAIHRLHIPIGFIHLPLLPAQAGRRRPRAPALELDIMVAALEQAIGVILGG